VTYRDFEPAEPELDESTGITYPYVIEGAFCMNCLGKLAWRLGVGRHAITHAHGHDACSQPTHAKLADDQKAAADAAYVQMNDIFEAHLLAEAKKARGL
jgi:hypothetical protein